jgi:leucyl/phenylalanyl-tRNA---protein transferase
MSHGPTRRLDTALLLRAYGAGLFPMADTRDADDVFWVEPRRRGLLPLDAFHLPRSMLKVLKQERFVHSRDRAFDAVIAQCAEAAPGRQQTWINPVIMEAYQRLHQEGHAHSIETWTADGTLAGGLYGVRLGGAFFGESMFSRATDASKAALAHLVVRLRAGGFQLLDTQFLTTHLARFGGQEVRRSHYVALLNEAVAVDADWTALDGYAVGTASATGASGAGAAGSATGGASAGAAGRARRGAALPEAGIFGPSGKLIAQLLSQTS